MHHSQVNTFAMRSLLGILLGGALFSCHSNSQSKTSQDTVAGVADSLPPVETKAPNSNYKPAFEGQTRVKGATTKTPIEVTLLDSTLKYPWAICNLPDGRLLITEKLGTMRIETLDGKLDKKITGLPKVNADGQGGLLDVNIDPDFAHNRMVYFDYAEPGPTGNLLAVAKGKLSKDETHLENIQVIYRAEPAWKGTLQYGSRILFDKDGNLFVSTGERSDKQIRTKAQDLSAAIGKVLHITKDGKPVPGGPFVDSTGALPEIYAYGFRNPEGMAINPATGDIWEVEFGPKGGDELNIVRPGKNYGWPVITYGREYSGEAVGAGIQQQEGMEQPVYYWDPVISPSGMTFYNSDTIAEWKGNIFIACLSSSHVTRLVLDGNRVAAEQWLLQDMGQRFRAITQAENGALYVVSEQGNLYKIAKK
ncbi:Glucose/arabinose dehydrogenase, beta-propeller fold [Arachidicoccus rhizosphaerae]|uniref:Glucose/arabinose dehydrogenase, beta-propeller fold n=1 Tax=Arachidicoccus rhizosphaerae TaxID=551991 RepID=A0A1H3YID1_9BACT|nr:PQQ-dependent sugar dehydrogenase [Arachidicoccus rhizosphaerae]SEA10971.1 Glucose/arabinose dehydrogenase, beta-propeller fold [Arachidicoccus rhizosphaerae]